MAPDYLFRPMTVSDLPLIRHWLALPHVRVGTRGIDLFIGEPDMIERGHGSALVRCFVDDRLQKGAPRIVTDPDPANGRAVRAYEKAGFEKDRMVETPDGPALLMIRNP